MSIKCPDCGAELKAGSKFCTECGALIRDNSSPEKNDSQSTPAQPDRPASPVQNTQQQQYQQQQYQQPPRQDFQQNSYVPPAPPHGQGQQPNANYNPNFDYTPMGPWNWFGTFLLLSIPLVNIILIIVWACGGCKNINRRNYARGQLILIIFNIVVSIVLLIIFWTVFCTLFNSLVRELGSSDLYLSANTLFSPLSTAVSALPKTIFSVIGGLRF